MPTLDGFIGGAYTAISTNFDAQRCVNLYPERSESGTSKTIAMLVGTPGLAVFATVPAGTVVRGMINFNDVYAFIVVGQYVYRLDTLGDAVLTGTCDNATTPVSMATNGTTIFFVTGPKGFVITVDTNTVAEYIDVSFTGADRVDFIDGSYVFNQPNTGKFWAMNPYSTTLNPLYFATAEGSPDGLVSLIVNNREIWLFGALTTEVWTNTGDTVNFPYARIGGAFIQQGCAAKNSVARMYSTIFWLGSNENGQGMVFRTNGYTPERISTHAIERAISQYATISDAIAYCYQTQGHSFYVLTFPNAEKTWVYDTTTSLWHERNWRKNDGSYGRHRSNCHMFFARKNIVGDWELGLVYDMNLDVYSDNGNTIVRLRAAPYINQEQVRLAHNIVQFDMETGVGLNNPLAQGYTPQALLRWSDDGGHQWSSQREASIGKLGQFLTRLRFTRLGQSRQRVYELSISDPVKVVLISAIINGQ